MENSNRLKPLGKRDHYTTKIRLQRLKDATTLQLPILIQI